MASSRQRADKLLSCFERPCRAVLRFMSVGIGRTTAGNLLDYTYIIPWILDFVKGMSHTFFPVTRYQHHPVVIPTRMLPIGFGVALELYAPLTVTL
jgi:hypothetical protein